LINDANVTGPKFCARNLPIKRERGYALLGLMLVVSLLAIAAAAVAPTIALQIKRDREEEMIHRGIQYRRAIRSFSKHTGRFPLRVEELEDTNGARYLRKAYKDPITGGEFRLLHMNDIAAYGAGLNPGINTAGLPAGGGTNLAFATASPAPATAPTTATDPPAEQNAPQSGPDGQAAQTTPPAASAPGDALGGGLIFGVASRSKKKTIREFNHKSRYDQWLFFYSAIYDGSFEVKGPTPQSPISAQSPISGAQKTSPDSSSQTALPSQPAPQSPPQ
jgi:type II secretory pathway pseudopilin PulG